MLGTLEIGLIAVAVIVAFGSLPKAIKGLPDLGHAMGSFLGNMKKGKREIEIEVDALKEPIDEIKAL